MKYEDLLPVAVCRAVEQGKCTVRVESTHDAWFGVTHKEDKPIVVEKLRQLKAKGVYTEKLW